MNFFNNLINTDEDELMLDDKKTLRPIQYWTREVPSRGGFRLFSQPGLLRELNHENIYVESSTMNRSLKNIVALFYIAKSSIKKTTLIILALLNIQSARFSMSEEKEPVVRNDDVQTSLINAHLQTLCWSISAILLSFLCLMHLGVMLSFALGWSVSFFVAPIALFFALVVGDWLARRGGLRGMLRIVPPVIGMTVLILALFLAASFFDMSWDGLWYHQTAVYQMSHGWNPIYDPMHSFVPHGQCRGPAAHPHTGAVPQG